MAPNPVPGTGRPVRRGIALLITLAAVLFSLTVATIIARQASVARLSETFDRSAVLADDLLVAADDPIRHWLDAESGEAVAPVDAAEPVFEVLRDRWTTGGVTFELHITAYDQFGMVSISAARAGSPLRMAVPSEVVRVIDRLELTDSEAPGLDLLIGVHQPDTDPPIYPDRTDARAALFADGAGPDAMTPNESTARPVLSIGSLLATHNGTTPSINVNTAPIALIESVMRTMGRGGFDQVVAARREQKVTNVGVLAAPPANDQSSSPRLVASSSCWAFRTDIAVGPVRRAFWSIYVRTTTGWRCVQRLAIHA